MRGRILHVRGSDSLPYPNAWAYLHRVTPDQGEIVDSQLTDRTGRYRLRGGRPGAEGAYVVSTTHQGIAYFSDPFDRAADSIPALLVFDTSSTEPRIRLAERHVVVQPPAPDGTRRVIEVIVLRNPGTTTRVAPDTAHPSWEGRLATGALEFEVGTADVSLEAIYRRDDAVAVSAPVPPGQRQLVIGYLLPRLAEALSLPIDQSVETLNVLVADSGAAAEPPLAFRSWETLQDLPYQRFAAGPVDPGTVLTVRFGHRPFPADAAVVVLAGAAAVALGAALVIWYRRARRRALLERPFSGDDPDLLAAQIAALDAAFEGRETARYRERRKALVARLDAVLAERRQPR